MSALRISYQHDVPRYVDLGPAYAAAASPIGRLSAAWGNLGDEDTSCAVGAGPVEVRKATAAELARLDGPPARTRAPQYAMAKRREDRRTAGLRGAQATHRLALAKSNRRHCPHVTDRAVRRALAEAGGDIKAASPILGVPVTTLWRRVGEMRRDEVAA